MVRRWDGLALALRHHASVCTWQTPWIQSEQSSLSALLCAIARLALPVSPDASCCQAAAINYSHLPIDLFSRACPASGFSECSEMVQRAICVRPFILTARAIRPSILTYLRARVPLQALEDLDLCVQ